jgi:hypothetical protein
MCIDGGGIKVAAVPRNKKQERSLQAPLLLLLL